MGVSRRKLELVGRNRGLWEEMGVSGRKWELVDGKGVSRRKWELIADRGIYRNHGITPCCVAFLSQSIIVTL